MDWINILDIWLKITQQSSFDYIDRNIVRYKVMQKTALTEYSPVQKGQKRNALISDWEK